MKSGRRTWLTRVAAALMIIAAAALLSTTVISPQNFALADKGGNGKGNGAGSGNGKGNGGGHGNGNGKGNGGGNDNGGNAGGNGNGEGSGNGGGNGNGEGNGHSGDKADGKGPANGDGSGHKSGRSGEQAEAIDDVPQPGPEQPKTAVPSPRTTQGRDRIVRNEVVVANASAALTTFARASGFELVRREPLDALGLDVVRLKAPETLNLVQARALISQRFPDAIVDFNHLYAPQTNLSLPDVDYAAKAVRWTAKLQGCDAATRLGLIDTGVDWGLPILHGAHGETASFVETGVQAAPPQHGTGIATLLVGQNGFGLIPDATLYSAGIFGVDDEGAPVASATSFAAAMNWLVANNVTTINASFSGPPDRLMELAIKRAQERGVELVAAVGNDGTSGIPRFPAAYPGVIGVTAVDQSGGVFSRANRGSFVALAAPGVDLYIPAAPSGGGRLVTGTSFAVPYVTAALASYGNDVKRMFAHAVDLGAPGPDPVFGQGLVQGPNICPSSAIDN